MEEATCHFTELTLVDEVVQHDHVLRLHSAHFHTNLRLYSERRREP